MKWRRILVAVAISTPVAPTYAGLMHSDFDEGGTYFGGVEGWFNYAGLPFVGIVSEPLGQPTNWLSVKPNQYWGEIVSQHWAVPDVTPTSIAGFSYFEFDLMADSTWIAGMDSFSLNIQLELPGQGQVSFPRTLPPIDLSQPGVVQHVMIDISDLQTPAATATGYNIVLNFRPGYRWEWDPNNPDSVPYDATIYYDNFQFTNGAIPEPTRLACLLPAFALVGTRRRT